MKTIANNTIIKHNNEAVLLNKQVQISDFEIISCNYNPKTGQTYLIISTSILLINNYKIFIRDNHLGLVISESVELNKPIYMHHHNWQNYQPQSYERFYSANIQLPRYHYFIVSHFFNSEENQLEIVLENSSVN